MKKKKTTKKLAARKPQAGTRILTGGDRMWLQKQFDELDRANIVILARIKETKDQNTLILKRIQELEIPPEVGPDSPVIPELAVEINKSHALSATIDAQVEDLPSEQTNKKKG
jgi:hypothetical protein